MAKAIAVETEQIRDNGGFIPIRTDPEDNRWLKTSHVGHNNSKLAAICYADAQEAAAHIKELVKPGDTVLVKGSRAMGMEVIVNALMGETDSNAHA